MFMDTKVNILFKIMRKRMANFKNKPASNLLMLLVLGLLAGFTLSCSKTETRWLRGNLHTHTFWSDGDDFPESVVKWYKENGYDFLAMTDHNMIMEGERWRSFPAGHPALLKYRETHGADWVVMQPDTATPGNMNVRLRNIAELRLVYDEPGSFLLIQSNEISNPHAVHLLALDQDRVIPASSHPAEERQRMIAETVANVDAYRQETGTNVYAALAHPNFRWAITAEMMIGTPDLRFFEVYNGHPQVNNDGDAFRASTDRIWDIVLAHRLKNGGKLLYGLATDDAHNYHGGGAGPGKGWVMVRSDSLSADAILDAIDKGDFYASTGVKLKDISFNGKNLKVEIDPEEGETYVTEYIGTKERFDPAARPALDSLGVAIENTTMIYSEEIGQVLHRSDKAKSSFRFTGDELYVRVRITSSADHVDPNSGRVLGKQKAWVQPVTLK
jgi:hypothetical protein